MKIRIFMLMCALILLGACASYSENESTFEVGNVTLISNDVIHRPNTHFQGGAIMTEDGGFLQASGIPFVGWIRDNLSRIPTIQYSDDMRVVVQGQYGHIKNWSYPEHYDEIRIIYLSPEDFLDGTADVSLPDEHGVYLLSVVVTWSGDDGSSGEFSTIIYVFKIEK